ncbi:sulfotransferase 1C4-like [Glandiceps talaboti]
MVDAETIKNSGHEIAVDKIRNFELRSDDILLLTYPKSGTTWMKEVLPLVLNGGNIDAIKDTPPDVRAPYLDFTLSANDPILKRLLGGFGVPDGFDMNEMASPRVLVSHLRYEFLPRQYEEKKPKVIYVARNPKDVAVSTFHFVQKELPAVNKEPYANFGEFLEDFGDAKNGSQIVLYDGTPWRDHVTTWWNRRHEPNVLFVTFEDMKRNLQNSVRKVAEFLEVKLDDEAVERIAHHCSFDSMKKNPMALKADYCANTLKVNASEASPFIRKGKVGGWKEHFTVAENENFDKAYKEWMKDSDLDMTFELSQ